MNKEKDDKRYNDIIDLPHHISHTHPQMTIINRAAQFAPFAALTGYEEAVKETARITEKRVELDENTIEILDEKFRMIQKHLSERPKVTITYFIPDESKEGGAYVREEGEIKKIDFYKQQIVLSNRLEIPMKDIIDLQSDLLLHIEEEPVDP